MIQDTYPVQWTGTQAVMTLPEHIDASNSGLVRGQLLSLINRGADILVADMTATVSCDHRGADALARVYQRATASGTRLRVAVTTPIVRRILDAAGLDRLISIYPSVEAAVAAGTPGNVIPLAARAPGGRVVADRPAQVPRQLPAITPAVLRGLVDALYDGVLLADDGRLVLVNQRLVPGGDRYRPRRGGHERGCLPARAGRGGRPCRLMTNSFMVSPVRPVSRPRAAEGAARLARPGRQ